MPFGIDDALILATLGSGALQGAMGAGGARGQIKEQKREFNKNYGLRSGGTAYNLAQSLDTLPMRDRAAYLLQARMGFTPSAFHPTDMFNPSSQPPSQGGIDMNQFAKMAGQYQPGMGGLNRQGEIGNQFMHNLDYGPPTAIQADQEEERRRIERERALRGGPARVQYIQREEERRRVAALNQPPLPPITPTRPPGGPGGY